MQIILNTCTYKKVRYNTNNPRHNRIHSQPMALAHPSNVVLGGDEQACHTLGSEETSMPNRRTVEPPPRVDAAMVRDVLRECYDPCYREKAISIVDMGLVHDVRVCESHIEVDILLTSGRCPFSMHIFTLVEETIAARLGIDDTRVRVNWQTPWSPSRLSDAARAKLCLPMAQIVPRTENRPRREVRPLEVAA